MKIRYFAASPGRRLLELGKWLLAILGLTSIAEQFIEFRDLIAAGVLGRYAEVRDTFVSWTGLGLADWLADAIVVYIALASLAPLFFTEAFASMYGSAEDGEGRAAPPTPGLGWGIAWILLGPIAMTASIILSAIVLPLGLVATVIYMIYRQLRPIRPIRGDLLGVAGALYGVLAAAIFVGPPIIAFHFLRATVIASVFAIVGAGVAILIGAKLTEAM